MTEMKGERVRSLVDQAREVRDRAYAPYSKFPVGAALYCEDGSVILGCNVENASYPLGLCAERAAVATAVAEGHHRFLAIAVVGSGPRPLTPCGGCRQVLSEFGDLWIIAASGTDGTIRQYRLSQLLPESFGEADLL